MLRRLLTDLGVKPFVECGNPNIWTSLFRSGGRGLLLVINHYSSPQETDIRIAGGGAVYLDETGITLKPMEIKRIAVSF
jgi:hypothetical protein